MTEDEVKVPAEGDAPAEEVASGGEAAPAGAPEAEEGSTKSARLSEAQWAEIVERAELGTSKASELAREFGITPQAVSNYFKKHGVIVGSRKHEVAKKVGAAVGAARAEEVVTFEQQRKARIEETKTEHYQWVRTIENQIIKRTVDTIKAGDPISKIDADIRTFNVILKSLEIGRKERYALLDVESLVDAEQLPEIVIRDLADEEITALQGASAENDDLDGLEGADEIVTEGDDD